MADPLEARICNWILELLAHTFGCLCALPAAGAVPAGALESFSDGADNLLIGIEIDFHVRQLFLDCGFIIPQDKVFFCDEVTLIKKIRCFLNCTPFVRQYGILFRKWGVFVCQRDNESTTELKR